MSIKNIGLDVCHTWSIKRLAWLHMKKNQHLSTRHLTPKLKLNLKLTFLVTGISCRRAALKRIINADQEEGRVEWYSWKTSIDRFSNPMTFAGARNKDFEVSKISCSLGYTVTDGIDTREREEIGKPLQFETFLGVAISKSINSLKHGINSPILSPFLVLVDEQINATDWAACFLYQELNRGE